MILDCWRAPGSQKSIFSPERQSHSDGQSGSWHLNIIWESENLKYSCTASTLCSTSCACVCTISMNLFSWDLIKKLQFILLNYQSRRRIIVAEQSNQPRCYYSNHTCKHSTLLSLGFWRNENYQLSIFQMYFHHQRWMDIYGINNCMGR
jgi:L-lactate utilization protein LutB